MAITSKHYVAFWTPSPRFVTDTILSFDEPVTPEQAIETILANKSNSNDPFSGVFKVAPRLNVVVVVPFEENQLAAVKKYLGTCYVGGSTLVDESFKAARRGETWRSVYSFEEFEKENKRWTLRDAS